MPNILVTNSVAAGATETNILTGSKFEFMGQNAAILVYSCFGTNSPAVGDILMDVTFGSGIVGDSLALPLEPGGVAGTGPDRQSQLIASGIAAAGDRLQIKLQNTDATDAHDVRTMVEIRPL